MKIIEKHIRELIPYENNPRHNDEAVEIVARSIEEFGFKVPVIIDADNVIVAGHTRIKAAELLGIDKVPVLVADDLTPEQVKAFRLADNRTAEIAKWDYGKLEIELSGIADIDMSCLGFELELDNLNIDSSEDEEYEVSVPAEPKSRLGDVYRLGEHTLMCGDSTLPESVGKLVGDATVDLLLTDPPYNVDYVGKTSDSLTIANDAMDDEQYMRFLVESITNAVDCMKDGASYYIFHADSGGLTVRMATNSAGLRVRQCLIWVKNSFVMGRQDYHWKHELILYGWKDGAAHYFVDDRTQSTILEADRPQRNDVHPTMKPVPLIKRLVANSTKAGDSVLDLFGGSGTTLMACEEMNRKCFMMEYDPAYCDVIIDRWTKYTGLKAVKI